MPAQVVAISLEQALLSVIDRIVKEYRYSSRSELVREAIRRLVAEYEFSRLRGREVVAAIVVVYDYGSGGTDRQLARARHEYSDIVLGNLHLHVGGSVCTELLVAKGMWERVQELVAVIRGIRGVISSSHVITPLGHG